jgi:hypothetical protein
MPVRKTTHRPSVNDQLEGSAASFRAVAYADSRSGYLDLSYGDVNNGKEKQIICKAYGESTAV